MVPAEKEVVIGKLMKQGYTENIHMSTSFRLSSQDISRLILDVGQIIPSFKKGVNGNNHDTYLNKYISELDKK